MVLKWEFSLSMGFSLHADPDYGCYPDDPDSQIYLKMGKNSFY